MSLQALGIVEFVGQQVERVTEEVLGSEIVQFILALVLFLAILVGSYWFVYLPTRRRNPRDPEDRGSE